MILIFRDVLSHLNAEDQLTFRHWIGRKLNLRTRAINSVWSTHVTAFPRSRKRFLFILFMIAFVGVAVGYQLWRVVFAG
jgi:hypothetical protein